MHRRWILTLLLGMLFGGVAGAGAVYLFVGPNAPSSADHGLPFLKGSPQTPELKDGLRVLDQFAGTWDAEVTVLPAERTPVEKRQRVEITAEWALNRRFLLTRTRDENGTEGLALRTYDLEKKEYPYWNFNAHGGFYMARGRRSETTSTLTTEGTTPE